MKVIEKKSYDEMSRDAAEAVFDVIKNSRNSIKKFTIALSGGSSPAGLYKKMAEMDVDWNRICFFMVDERKIRLEHKDSNFKMIKETLLSRIDIPRKNVYPVNVSYRKVEDSALEYEERIKNFFNNAPVVFDLMILGIGPDGHTASLFPGRKELHESKRIVIPALAPDRFSIKERITMTLPVLNQTKERIFVVSGKERARIIKGVIKEDSLYPASLVNRNSTIYTDFQL